MKTLATFLFTTFFVGVLCTPTRAAEIDGKWKAEFETQIGVQKYVFELKADGEKLTGKAMGERETDKSDVAISEGKIVKDEVSFVETLKFDGMDLRIEYKGKLAGDELKLSRNVADMATEELVAKRVK